MDQMQQPATTQTASVRRGDEPISGGVKALLVIIAILLPPLGSLIAWVYGARNADRPGAGLIRVVGLIFTVLTIMGGLVLGAAVALIPGFLVKGQDDFLAQSTANTPSPPAVQMQAGQSQALAEAPPEIAAKIAELRAAVAASVQLYYKDHGKYPSLDELNAAGLLDERFKEDPAHPEENYLVQVTPWSEAGKPGCNVNVKYTGPEAYAADSAMAEPGKADQPAGTAPAEAAAQSAKEAADVTRPAFPAHHDSGKRGAARWKQYM